MTTSYTIPRRRRDIVVVVPDEPTRRAVKVLAEEIAAQGAYRFTFPEKGGNWSYIAPKADLLWVHDTLYPAAFRAFRAATAAQRPTVITLHGGSAPVTAGRPIAALADTFITRPMLQKATRVTFTNDAAADFYYRQIQFTSPVSVIPDAVDVRLFQPCFPEKRYYLRARFALRDTQPVLLFTGRLTDRGGLAAIKHMARQMPDWRFWLAGDGKGKPEHWYLPNVQVLRSRTPSDMAELYQAADFLIAPVSGGVFPPSFQDAIACGLPVMCAPEAAAGNRLARTYMYTAAVDPLSAAKTAEVWMKRLKAVRGLLPLTEPKMELADLAQNSWDPARIAGPYVALFDSLCFRAEAVAA